MLDVLLIVGHSERAKGAANMNGPEPDDDLYEFDFNRPLAGQIELSLRGAGIKAERALYDRRRRDMLPEWNGASRLLVELHCNAFDGRASGTEVLYAKGSERGRAAARILQKSLVSALGLPDRGVKWRHPDGPEPHQRRGAAILFGVSQPALIPEPFFIDNDHDLARARNVDLAGAYVDGIVGILEILP